LRDAIPEVYIGAYNANKQTQQKPRPIIEIFVKMFLDV
jgi:hypothetical protein